METQTQTRSQHWLSDRHDLASPELIYRIGSMDPKQKFYRHFQDSVEVLQDQILQLESTSPIAGERQAAIDHVLAGITKLQNEVADAVDFTPSYDRRQYSETVRSLQDDLNRTVAKITPKSRFQFRRTTKTPHVDMGAPENDPRFSPGSLSCNQHSPQKPTVGITETADDVLGDFPNLSKKASGKDYNAEMKQVRGKGIRQPSFSAAREIKISDHSGLHIILPESAARATSAGSVTNLQGCIVDMSIPTAQGAPFPGLALKNISKSLIVAGRVNGAVHITGVSDSILVVTARQVRIHECKNVDIYLHCASHPIIEDCSGMRFAPLPRCYMSQSEESVENQWDQVDDFKWLKAGHSPNWNTLSDNEVLDEEIWKTVVPGQPGTNVEDILRRVGLPRS